MNKLYDQLVPILDPGESVEWTGKPEPFHVMEPNNKKALYLRWILSAVIGVILIVLYSVYSSVRSDMEFMIIVPLIIAAVVVFIIIRPVADARTIMKKRTYAVTSQRVLVYENENTHPSMPLDGIDQVRFIRKEGGTADVVFGSAVSTRWPNSLRSAAVVSEKNPEKSNQIEGMVFYNVKNSEQIRSLLAPGTKILDF